jgi:hypothetical protein
MVNLTNYDDQFILDLIKQVNGNPYKCTANVQYAVKGNNLIPVLSIYQDNSTDWDVDDVILFCERVDAVDFCNEVGMSIFDMETMLEYYSAEAYQQMINDLEYEEEYREWMAQELAWYNHARMMGWE